MADRFGPDDWVRAGLHMLAKHGIAAVKVEPLAKQLGVTKGGFYWHFRDRPALLAAILAKWESAMTLAIIDRVEALGGDAAERLKNLFEIAMNADGRLEMAVRAWAAADVKVMAVIARVDRRRLDYLEELLRGMGLPKPVAVARSRLVYYGMIGEFNVAVPTTAAERRNTLRLNYAMISRWP
jgi:AcrR family transcriptional regulator